MEKPKNEDKMEENTINTDETAESAVLDAETNAAGYMLAEQDLAEDAVSSHGRAVTRARKAARRQATILAEAGYSEDDLVQGYLARLQKSGTSFDPAKGNRDQFNAGVLRNFMKEIAKEATKRMKTHESASVDDILARCETNEDPDSDDGFAAPVSAKMKSGFLDYMEYADAVKLRGVTRIEVADILQLAKDVFKADSLEYKIFASRYLSNVFLKRTELAKAFGVTVEKIRWTEKKIAAAAPFFGVKRPPMRTQSDAADAQTRKKCAKG